MTQSIERSIELEIPASAAYRQWNRFEEYPHFLTDVEAARQVDDRHVEWRLRVGDKPVEFTVEICERIPDKRIAWRSVSGPWHAGAVTFHRLSEKRSKVMVQFDHDPEGVRASLGGRLGLVERRVGKDLESFKTMVESRQSGAGTAQGSQDRTG